MKTSWKGRKCPVCSNPIEGVNYIFQWERRAFPFFFLKKYEHKEYYVLHDISEDDVTIITPYNKKCQLTKEQWESI